MTDYIATPGMIADKVRPLVLGASSEHGADVESPPIAVERGTLTAALQHLDELERRNVWQPLASAPRDGTMIWLLVDYRGDDADNALVDNVFGATIGFNNLDNDGDDLWLFAGWCWSHDHFTDGSGKPFAWKPVGFELAPPPCFQPFGESGTA